MADHMTIEREQDARPEPEQVKGRRLLGLDVFLAVACVVFIGYVLCYFNYLQDDVLIPFRYVLNMLHGHGYVLNVGEPPVEGCTSPLFLWLLTPILAVFSADNAIIFWKFVGLGLGCIVLWKVKLLANMFAPTKPVIGNVAVLLLAVNPEFAFSMTNAMETGIATFLFICGLHSFLSSVENKEQPVKGAVWLLLAALARPELTLAFPILMVVYGPIKLGWKPWLTYLAPLAIFLAARYCVYHDLVPNTFWAKHYNDTNRMFGDGLSYVFQHVLLFPTTGNPADWPQWISAGLAALGAIMLCVKVRHCAAFILLLGIHLCFVICNPDWMPEVRPIAPVFGLLMIAYASAIVWFVTSLASFPFMDKNVKLFVSVVLSAGVCWGYYTYEFAPRQTNVHKLSALAGIDKVFTPHEPLMCWRSTGADSSRVISDWVKRNVKPGELVGCTEMALPPLLNMDVRFMDMRALSDRDIAHMNSYSHSAIGVVVGDICNPDGEVWPYLMKRKPNYILLLQTEDNPHDNDKGYFRRCPDFSMPSPDGNNYPIKVWRRSDMPEVGSSAN